MTQSRMEKYYQSTVSDDTMENGEGFSRTKKNKDLYKEVSNLELNDFDLNSNVSILGDNSDNIDISELEEKLSLKYKKENKNKGLGNTDEIPLPKINLDETREYDINSILKKAKEDREINYEEDRLKRIRNTQYDILKGLDIFNKDEEVEENEEVVVEEEKPKEDKQLIDLIDTITAKELIKEEENLEVTGDMDPLDLLSDLRGDDENTRVMGVLSEENASTGISDDIKSDDVKEIEEVKDKHEKEKVSISDEEEDASKDDKLEKTEDLEQDEFDDFKDIKDDMKASKIIVRILIIILILLFIAGCILLANSYFDLGLF